MSTAPLRFVGISSYSEDFQSILNRAVSIASVPVKQLQNQQANLLTKKQLLASLNTDMKSLADSIAAVGTVGGSKALTATSSNANRVTVTLNGATLPAGYTITDITSVAKAASENTATGLANTNAAAVDTDDNLLELVLGSQTYSIDLTTDGNHLNGLAAAINALGIGVQASVLNTGSGATPYYLSLTATVTGQTTLALRTTVGNEASNILTATNQGANAVFKLNDLQITRTDNVITDVISGVTFTIVDKTAIGEAVSLTLSSNRGTLSAALQNMVSAYNKVKTSVEAQIGENAGLLSGDYIIRQAQSLLRQVSGYRGSGTVASLAELGVRLSKTGEMSFDSAAFFALSTNTFNASFSFLGSPTTGFGGVSQSLYQMTDPVTGLIKTQQNNYDTADARLSRTIEELAGRITNMQQSLSSKLQQADVLLSSLQSQQRNLDASLQSLQLLTFGKKES